MVALYSDSGQGKGSSDYVVERRQKKQHIFCPHSWRDIILMSTWLMLVSLYSSRAKTTKKNVQYLIDIKPFHETLMLIIQHGNIRFPTLGTKNITTASLPNCSIYIKSVILKVWSRISRILSGGPWSQNYFHNNTKIVFASFISSSHEYKVSGDFQRLHNV